MILKREFKNLFLSSSGKEKHNSMFLNLKGWQFQLLTLFPFKKHVDKFDNTK